MGVRGIPQITLWEWNYEVEQIRMEHWNICEKKLLINVLIIFYFSVFCDGIWLCFWRTHDHC